MKFGFRAVCLDHETGSHHPERPQRLRAVREHLEGADGLSYEHPPDATEEDLTRIHDPGYVERVRSFCADGGGRWTVDTPGVEATWAAALASAGIACWAVETALDGRQAGDTRKETDAREGDGTPFSLGRPPGHHAVADDAMGFCFFNNVAVAVERALDSSGIDRVAIVDWDVHHGNGTQDVFYDRDDVFYASIHERGIYPGTGDVDETGRAGGNGATLNVPLPGRSGDADYLAAIEDAVSPAIRRYDPGLLVVSAGFDAHERDTISSMTVSSEGYGVLTDRVRELCRACQAPVAFVLEGGYDLEGLGESVRTVQDTFGGREPVEPDGNPGEGTRDVLEAVRKRHGLDRDA